MCCGEKGQEFLTFDHVNNDGANHRKKVPASALVNWIHKNNFPLTIQVLCYNCNNAKAIYETCPHQFS